MVPYLDEYFSRFTVLEQPERGSHALHFDGEKVQHKDAIIAEFKERLAAYYPHYDLVFEEKYMGPGRVYIQSKPVARKRGGLDSLI